MLSITNLTFEGSRLVYINLLLDFEWLLTNKTLSLPLQNIDICAICIDKSIL
jgi:hypothetical protein